MMPRGCRQPSIWVWMRAQGSLLLLIVTALGASTASAATAPLPSPSSPVPVLAYYYIWYSSSSWDRAKSDLPALGAYSSDDEMVMRQHIEWAKQAGVTGFIVSWKNTDVLTPRLAKLVDIAREEHFKLAIIYQGLDFNRDPVPPLQVATDIDYFSTRWGDDPVFSIFDRPVVIWSGTWKFTPEQIQSVTTGRRERVLILASERSVEDYSRVSQFFDGDAYYWSSVNPATFPGYGEKLIGMSTAVHADHGIWIAPAAPGFDARAIGGTTVVERNDGSTFLTEFNTASTSSPDAIGIISWNEFSENSYIEPSRNYDSTYLMQLSSLLHAQAPSVASFDSDAPDGSRGSPNRDISLLLVFAGLMLSSVAVVAVRSIRSS